MQGDIPDGEAACNGESDEAPSPESVNSLEAEIRRQRLLIGHHEAQIDSDPDLLAESISLAVPLQDLVSLGEAHCFRHRTSSRIAGDIGLTATTTTPVAIQVDDHPDCSIVLLNQGCASYWVEGHEYQVRRGESAMFLPGMVYQMQSGDRSGGLCSGLVYNLSPQLLARYLCELSPMGLELEQALRMVQQPHHLDLQNPQLKPVLYGLQLLVRTIDSLGAPPMTLPTPESDLEPEQALMAMAPQRPDGTERGLLHLQEGIYALSAALLLPDQAERALASWDPLPPARPR